MYRNEILRFLWGRIGAKAGAGGGFVWLLTALGLLAALLILLREVNYGVGLVQDSIAYLSVARSLASGAGLVDYTGAPLTLWPPLFPILVAVPGVLGVDAAAAAGLVNAVAVGALVLAAGWWLRGRYGSILLAVWGALAVMLASPIANVGTWAVSEPVYILLMALTLTQVVRFLDSGRRQALVWAAAFTALACLTRYSGVAIVITVALLLLCRRESWPDKVRDIALYAAIAALPVGIWMARNFLIAGVFSGYRTASATPLSQNITDMLHILAPWALPAGGWLEGNAFLAPLGLLALAPVAAAGILAIRQYRESGRISAALLAPAAFVLIYIMFFMATGSVTQLGTIDNRYMSPIYVPLIFTVASVAAWPLRRQYVASRPAADVEPSGMRETGSMMRTGWLKPALRRAPLVGLFLWLAYPLATNAVVDIRYDISEGTGWYSNARWTNSELTGYLKRHLSGIEYGKLYSNEPYLSYFSADAPDVHLPANRSDLHSIYSNPAATDGIYALWVEGAQIPTPAYGRHGLEQSLPNPEVLIDVEDGALFYVSAASIAGSKGQAVAAAYAAAQEMGAPAVSAVYDLYIDDRRLIYIKDPCGATDTAETFWLHLYPADRGDLYEYRMEHGYNILDFEFESYGRQVGAVCVASIPYPGYDIARIRTGQYNEQGRIWEAGVDFRLSAIQQAQLDALADRAPVVSDRFAVYLLDGELAYLKEPCTAADTAALFYLHIVPSNRAYLPAEQREHGFDNRDFTFADAGWAFEDKCLVTVELPEYGIALIRTGQYDDAGRLWESEFPVSPR